MIKLSFPTIEIERLSNLFLTVTFTLPFCAGYFPTRAGQFQWPILYVAYEVGESIPVPFPLLLQNKIPFLINKVG